MTMSKAVKWSMGKDQKASPSPVRAGAGTRRAGGAAGGDDAIERAISLSPGLFPDPNEADRVAFLDQGVVKGMYSHAARVWRDQYGVPPGFSTRKWFVGMSQQERDEWRAEQEAGAGQPGFRPDLMSNHLQKIKAEISRQQPGGSPGVSRPLSIAPLDLEPAPEGEAASMFRSADDGQGVARPGLAGA